nr:hypothetical protein [uncultured Schaedlerella sp.]
MIWKLIGIFDLVVKIYFLSYGIFSLYKFIMGDKGKQETLWYGLLALFVATRIF